MLENMGVPFEILPDYAEGGESWMCNSENAQIPSTGAFEVITKAYVVATGVVVSIHPKRVCLLLAHTIAEPGPGPHAERVPSSEGTCTWFSACVFLVSSYVFSYRLFLAVEGWSLSRFW